MMSHVQIRSMFNMKLFIDTDADSRLSKRVLKDVDELGRDLDQVLAILVALHLTSVIKSLSCGSLELAAS